MQKNPLTLSSCSGFAAWFAGTVFVFLLGAPRPALGDVYERGNGGNFNDPVWIDTSTTPPDPDSGPPGAGDTALIEGGSAYTITASGGAVNLLEGTTTFSVTGSFSATTLSYSGLLMGSGTLTVQTVSGASPALLTIEGGNLVATTMAEDFQVTGGSLKVTTFTGLNGSISDGGIVTLLNNQSDLNLSLSSGAQLTLPALSDGFGQSISIDGAGSLFTVTDAMEEDAGSIMLSNGAQLTVGANLNLDGATSGGETVGGGGSWSDANTTVTVTRTLAVGLSVGSTSLAVENGAAVLVNGMMIGQNAASTGSVTEMGSGTIIQVSEALGIGTDGNGTLQMESGASLAFQSQADFAVGFDQNSVGVLTADGAMTIIDARQAMTGVGVNAGSSGHLTLTKGAQLLLGSYVSAGEAGNGLIEADSGSQIQVTQSGAVRSGQTAGFVIGGAAAGKGDFGGLSVQDAGTQFSCAIPIVVARDAGSSGGIGVTGSFTSSGNLTVGQSGAGTINEAAGGQMIVNGAQTIALFGGNANSSGIVAIQDSGTLLEFNQIAQAYFGNAGKGQLTITGGAAASYVSPLDSTGAPSGELAFGYLEGSEGDLTVDGAGSTFTTNAVLIIGGAGKAVWRITNGGSVQTDLTGLGADSGSSPSVTVDGAGSNWTNTNTLALADGTPSITVSNGATLRCGPELDMLPEATVTISGGQALVAQSVDSFGPVGSLRIGQGGTVLGKGKIIGQVIVGLGGKYNPGGDPGTFTVQGDFTQESGGEMDIDLGGTVAGVSYDQLHVTGTAVLGGTLKVTAVDGFQPGAQESFTILTASSISGKFSQVIGADVTYSGKSIVVKPTLTPARLTVSVNPTRGGGTVSPGFLGVSTRDVGYTYTVTATPAKGMSFAGWTGSLTSADAKLTFTMQAGMTLEASFVPTPFAPVTGAYRGLATGSSGAADGLLSLSILGNGAFTAKFSADGTAYSFKGVFNSTGALQESVTLGGHALVADLQVNLTGGGISGTISIDGTSYSIDASSTAFNARTNPAPEAGAYTLCLPPNPADAGAASPPPQGDGWATASISKAGLVKLAGRLADNTAWSASGSLATDGTFDLYASLYHGHGLLAGTLNFAAPPRDPSASVSDVTGALGWSAPADNAKNAVISNAFDTTLDPVGSFYVTPPKNTRVLPGLDSAGDAQLLFAGGGLPSNFPSKPITITLRDIVHYAPTSRADKLTMTFNTATGAVSGKFYNGSAFLPFSGVVLQKQEEGDGLFSGPAESGTVTLSQ